MSAGADGPGPGSLAADAVALESADVAWSGAELANAADGVGAALRRATPRGDRSRIAHCVELSPAGAVAIHAIGRSGAVLAPAHADWKPTQLAGFLAAVRPHAALVTAGRAWAPGWDRTAVAVAGFGWLDLLTPATGDAGGPLPGLPAGTEVLLSTSGSGGVPRIVCHSWRGLRANAAAANRRADAGTDSVTLATLAWAHVGGLAVVVRAAEGGGRIACAGARFDAGAWASALERHGVTHLSVVPVMLERLLDAGAAPGALRFVLTGGAATPAGLLDRALVAGWPIALTYGLTEAGSQVATATPAEVAARGEAGLLDRTLDGMEIRLRDHGSVSVRGPSVMLGYLGETPGPGPDGWLETDDLAARDAAGALGFAGRRSTRIGTGGTNVDPAEIEAAVREHPAVAEVCVLGLPDERWGEIVAAVVETAGPARPPADDPAAAEAALSGELDAWVRERLDGPRRPRIWRFVDRLPRTATGKLDRAAIRALAETPDATPVQEG